MGNLTSKKKVETAWIRHKRQSSFYSHCGIYYLRKKKYAVTEEKWLDSDIERITICTQRWHIGGAGNKQSPNDHASHGTEDDDDDGEDEDDEEEDEVFN